MLIKKAGRPIKSVSLMPGKKKEQEKELTWERNVKRITRPNMHCSIKKFLKKEREGEVERERDGRQEKENTKSLYNLRSCPPPKLLQTVHCNPCSVLRIPHADISHPQYQPTDNKKEHCWFNCNQIT